MVANVEMAAAWDGAEGEDWARDWQRYDLGVRRHHVRLMEAAALRRTDHVLDVGCGNGEVTRDAARVAVEGHALGVDLSSPMLTRARELALADGLTNVAFELADAQVHPFEPEAHDLVISRFGAMFFADPAAAFANLARTTRPGGRLVLLSWQEMARNEWLQVLRGALAMGREIPSPQPGTPGPFGLAEPDAVRDLLTGAGFEVVAIDPVDEPFWAGAEAQDAFGFLSGIGVARGLLGGLSDSDRQLASDALRQALAAHQTPSGVLLGSAAWLVIAERIHPAGEGSSPRDG